MHKHHVQTKVHKREKQCKADKNEKSKEHVETDEDDDSDTETDANGRFSFTRAVPDEVPMRKKNIPEHKKRNTYAISAETEHERVIANCIRCKVKWSKFHTKKELNWNQNDKTGMCKHLWGINMKILLARLI